MEYSIKEISKNIDITEQGLYKRIRSNFDAYIKKGYITTKLIEQPSGTREQVFLTEEGIKDLLKTKQLKETCINKDFLKLNQDTKAIEQPTKPSLADAEAPKQVKLADAPNNELLNLLNQNIADLKAENKRLIEKLDKQELRFDEKLKEQKEEFNEAFNRQNEAYQKALNTISLNFNNLLQRLPPPQEEQTASDTTNIVKQEEIQTTDAETIETKPKGFKGFLYKLFKSEW